MIRNLTSILILTLCLSHCVLSTTDSLNIGAAIYGGLEDKTNPYTAIKLLKKKDKPKDKNDR